MMLLFRAQVEMKEPFVFQIQYPPSQDIPSTLRDKNDKLQKSNEAQIVPTTEKQVQVTHYPLLSSC